ncbi:LmeA family phospholipid-binding protein [Gordonia humi]|uniref:DUF2993 domain-containing protein n=1 Tax=Gordonia humi TaxID=686429 RepID=A0A840EXG9_9ACTN|nr:DUF2993 domain-containing protein [Gordonia humi]MBB4134983.1 hypothetical protein [Gordonia humi]
MTATPRIRPARRAAQVAAATVVVVVIVVVIGFLADNVAASRAEHRLAAAVEQSAGVRFEPEVTIGGFPFLTDTSGPFPSILVSARGVRVGGCGDRGECTVTMDARLGDAATGSIWEVDADTEIAAGSVDAETRIDSVNLGRLMGITDLYINTPGPEDKAGAGGPGDGLVERTDGIMLSGTVPFPGSPERQGQYPPSAVEYTAAKAKVSVSAKVFVGDDGRVHIEATKLYDGPEMHYSDDVPAEFYAHVLDRFSAVLPVLPMAWNVAADKALSRGSDLIVAGNTKSRIVKPRDFHGR